MFGAIAAGLGIAKSLFGSKKPTAGIAPSPYMDQDDMARFYALKNIMRQIRNPYIQHLSSKGEIDDFGSY